MSKRVLITGASGFIGAHTVEGFLRDTDWEIVGIVSFRHNGCPLRLAHLQSNPRFTIIYHDLRGPITPRISARIGKIDIVFDFAAESHVDRSIVDPEPFIRNNVEVMMNVLSYCRNEQPEVLFHISTDEVYGPSSLPLKEWSPIIPSNPYSASKAAQEDIAISYWRTYNVPLVITNTMNNFGERQDKEKFIPLVIKRILDNEEIVVHSKDGQPGGRFYLHARNHANALLFLATHTTPQMYPWFDRPSRWNIVGEKAINNTYMVRMIANILEMPVKYKLTDFHSSRPGHDLWYNLDGSKLAELGYSQAVSFEESLERVVRWTLDNPEWLK